MKEYGLRVNLSITIAVKLKTFVHDPGPEMKTHFLEIDVALSVLPPISVEAPDVTI